MKTDFGSAYWRNQVGAVAALSSASSAATAPTPSTDNPPAPAPRKRWHVVNGRVVPGGIGEPKDDPEPPDKTPLRKNGE